eukprot:320571_1
MKMLPVLLFAVINSMGQSKDYLNHYHQYQYKNGVMDKYDEGDGFMDGSCITFDEAEEEQPQTKVEEEESNIKLLKIKSEVEKYESELIETKKELNNYKSGNKIPILLQNTIISKLCLLKEQIFRIETENKTYRMQLETENEKHNYFNLCSMIKNTLYVTCVDMHIGGEPLRIVVNGIPSLSKGKTLLDKRQLMIKNFDYYRKFLMHEPRGHFDMYGVIITECDAFGKKNNAHFAVLFMNNEGYSSMCGHGIIGITRYAIDYGLVKNNNNNNNNNNTIRIQCPCGIVESTINNKNEISFISTPGWAEYISTSIQLDQFGKIEIDIGYGGSYYVICPSTRFNLNVCDSPIDDIISISTLIKQTVIKKLSLSNPDSKDLEFLHGIILTDGINASNESSLNICVFADRQVDRSPTGSGIIARLAVDYAKKNIKIGQKRKFVGKTGSILSGEIVKVLQNYKNKKNAVIVKVTGTAKYIATSQFYLEDGDELGRGFLIS